MNPQSLRSFIGLLLLLLPVCSLQAQTWQWASRLLGTSTFGAATCKRIAPDGAGGLVVAGEFHGVVQLGTTTLTSQGGADIFVARLDAAGNWLQVAQAGGTATDYVEALAVAGNGDAVVAGYFQSPALTVGPYSLLNQPDASGAVIGADVYVARLNATGTWTQAVRAGGIYREFITCLALGAGGEVIVAGTSDSATAAFGSLTLTNSSQSTLFVARLSAAGSWTQLVAAGSAGATGTAAQGLCLTPTGEVVVAGVFTGPTTQFGSFVLTNSAPAIASQNTDLFVARLTAAGTWTGAVAAGNGSGNETITALALDANSDAVVAGTFYGPSTAFGPFSLLNADPSVLPNSPQVMTGDVFVARLSSLGTWTQAVRAGAAGNEAAMSLSLDGMGTASVAGYFRGGSTQFGSLTLANPTNPNRFQLFVARLARSGTWSALYGTGHGGSAEARGVLADGQGTLAVCGGFADGPVAFGSTVLAGGPYFLGFVARLSGIPTALAATRAAPAPALWPNPATTTATVALPAGALARPLLLLDALGRTARTYFLPAHATTATLNLIGLAPGLYVVRCGAASGRLVVE
jgi:hypothetical protein